MPSAPAAPQPSQTPFGGGFRPPAGINPLLQDASPAAPAPAYNPAPAAAPAAPVQPQGPFPGQGQQPYHQQQAPAPAQQQPAQAPQAQTPPEVLDFSGRKVSVPSDPAQAQALRELHADFQRQQGTLTRAQQQVADMARRFTSGNQAPAAPGGQPGGQAQQPAPASAKPFDPRAAIKEAAAKIDAEALQNALYDNPAQALSNVMEQVLAPVVDGLSRDFQSQLQQATEQANSYVQEQRTTEAYVGEFEAMQTRTDLFPDLEQMRPLMGQVIDDPNFAHLLTGPNPMQMVYFLARGLAGGGSASAPAAAQVQPQPVTVDSVLANQELVGQLMAHPNFAQPIIRSYLEGLRSGNPPMTIGSAPGGVAPAAPGNMPRNLKEATRGFKQALGI